MIDTSAAMIAGPVAAGTWLVILPVVLPIVFGAVLMLFRHEMRWHGLLALAGSLAMVVVNAMLFAAVLKVGPMAMTMGGWRPPFGITFAADLLGTVFSLTASFVGLVCTLYSLRDIGLSERRYGFYPFLMLLMAGVSGVFLTGDVFNLYVWFEVFVIASFGLLVLGSERGQIDGATKYAILNLVATTLFLIATAYLYGVFGTLNMADLVVQVRQAGQGAPLVTLASLFLVAFAMKAAVFPLNFWLPASYHTPRIVVSALFGGLLTKVGIYALLRILIMILPDERILLAEPLRYGAAATMLIGALGMLAQSDLRRMAGFLVIAGVGVMLSGIASGTAAALAGAIVYAVHSMLATSAIYILVGMIRERGDSFSLHDLGGLYRDAPWLFTIALILFLALAGLPPGSGLWPKVMLVKALIDTGDWLLATTILLSSLIITIALFRVVSLAFWRMPDSAAPARQPAAPASAALGYMSLAGLALPVLWIGLLPEPLIAVASQAARGLLDPSTYVGSVFPGSMTP